MIRPDLPGEEWRSVVGYEGLYEISSFGRIWSVPRATCSRTGRILRQATSVDGYPQQSLNKAGTQRTFKVHALVVAAFLGPRPAGMDEIRHMDGNKRNCTASNLVYGTRSENAYDRIAHGHHNEARKDHCPQGHAYDVEMRQGPGGRYRKRGCLTCRRKQNREYQARRRAQLKGSAA